MATKYSINTYNDGEWNGVALFADTIDLRVIIDTACAIYESSNDYADVAVMDMDTGEILWNGVDAEEYDEPDDWDREMGFDPYEGCYSYDC
jgi:hypothetical protein